MTALRLGVDFLVIQRLTRLLMTIGLACSIGLHWSLLQSVAWTSMLVGNLSTGSLAEAVQRTFDGKHPCSLCKVIVEGKKSEKKSNTLLPLKKFEGMNQVSSIVLFSPPSFPCIDAADAHVEGLALTPPTPPPRA